MFFASNDHPHGLQNKQLQQLLGILKTNTCYSLHTHLSQWEIFLKHFTDTVWTTQTSGEEPHCSVVWDASNASLSMKIHWDWRKTSALCVCVKFITLYSPVWRDSEESPAPIQYRSIRPHSIISISQSAALTVVTWPALLRPWSYYETNYIPFIKK